MSGHTPRSEEFHPSVNHWNLRTGLYKERVTKKQLQSLLLQSPPFIGGLLCDWKSKHLGAGIYEIWAEERP